MLKKALIGVILNGIALYVLVSLVEEISYTGGIKFFIIAGLVIGLLNTFVKPLLKIVSLPFVLITAGLFLIVINALILWITSYFLNIIEFRDVTFTFVGTGSYLIGAILFGVVNWAEHLLIKNK